jgi:UDP-N-acetylglucosamine 2-epimerase (non-hydrolysing)
MKRKKLLFIFGTRPEAIKMAPIILECSRHPEELDVRVCTTGQHKEMLQQVLDFFGIKPDFELSLMKPNQTLFDITADALKGIESVLNLWLPDVLLVQGDTTTAMTGAMAGFYRQVKVAHVEAGLRSGNIYSPFPEEVNRKIISTMTSYHFAPTELARQNLLKDNYSENIYITGNTVIDALLWGVEKVRQSNQIADAFSFLQTGRKMILITAHRRESFGQPFENICQALLELAQLHPDKDFVYPVHLNPNVQQVVYRTLATQSNIHLIKPVGYPELIWLMDRSYLVITDSGGVQEEAPSLGKPVLVMRDVTERQEGVDAGTAVLVGTDKQRIVNTAQALLTSDEAYNKMAKAVNPYGDGTTARQIVGILLNESE